MNISVTFYETIYYYLYKLIKLNNIFWSLEYVTVRNQYVMTELLKGILLWNVLIGSISYLFFFYNILLIINSFFYAWQRKKTASRTSCCEILSKRLPHKEREKKPASWQTGSKKFQIARSLWYARRRAIRLLFLFPHCQLYELFFAPSLERGCCKSFGFAGWWLIKSAVNCRVTY